MNKRRAVIIFLIGLALVLGSCAPLGSALYREFTERPAVSLTPGTAVRAEPAQVTENRRARLVVHLAVDTFSVQASNDNGNTEYHARYRFPLDYAITTSDGRRLVKQRSEVDWRDDTSDLSGRERQSSLVEKNSEADASGATLDVVAVYHGFDVPDDGIVLVTAALGEDDVYGAKARDVNFRIEHDLAVNVATLVTSGIFMLVGGWIIAIVGFVMVLATNTGSSVPQPELSGAQAAGVRKLAMFCHLSGLLGYLVPFGNVIGPLVVWLINREKHPYIDEQGKEALNFQLSVLAYALLSFALILVLLGLLLLPLLALFNVVMVITAAIKVKDGEAYRYPLTIRFLR